MTSAIDQYLQTLFAFVPQSGTNRRPSMDYVALAHVPAVGSEKVYSLAFRGSRPLFTLAEYRQPVWELINASAGALAEKPELEAIQAEVDAEHPVISFLELADLQACGNFSESIPGSDYYLMLWQRQGKAGVVECYEPYSRDDSAWANVIGALQVLSSQFEYAAR